MLNWATLLSPKRLRGKSAAPPPAVEDRTELERDHDRILFSTPVRRLADKTQVFPLDKNDSVRTRLTHSLEVSNLARSIGTAIVARYSDSIFKEVPNAARNVPTLLASIGLAHDLGNPPFGHQGEDAIASWFRDHSDVLKDLSPPMRQDFLSFEGNAQTLRILTQLQMLKEPYGLNLTAATLAALMKYSVPSDQVAKKGPADKKFGYFQSEEHIVSQIWSETGLGKGLRHPLTNIMEACDDIAYSILDAEDSVKKDLVSFPDLLGYLEHSCGPDSICQDVIKKGREFHGEHRKLGLSPHELNEVSMQLFRVICMGHLVPEISSAFQMHIGPLMLGKPTAPLIELSRGAMLVAGLKNFDRTYAYRNMSVLEIELRGHETIRRLMDYVWESIGEMGNVKPSRKSSHHPFLNYTFHRISENYRRVYLDQGNKLDERYKSLQLMTDMIAGMTDSFALALCDELDELYGFRERR